MRIILLHQAFVTITEAGGTRHHELARELVKLGHTVTIIASRVNYLTGKPVTDSVDAAKELELEPGITLIRVYTYPALHKSFFHRVLSFFSFMISSFIAALGVRRVDLVWGTSPPIFQGFTAWLIARLKGAAFLFEVRDLWPAFAIAVGVLRNKLLIRLSLWLEHFLYSHADTVMVNSPGFIEHVQQRGARRIELVPNGADAEMFAASEKHTDPIWQKKLAGKFICLYAGAHGLSNDLGVVLQAAAILKPHKDIAFVLIGDGKEKPALQMQAASLELKNVIFLPPVPKEDMASVFLAANACIAILKPLELYKTTYPNKVFDYMAAGRPVILAIDGVIREVVESAKAGVFTPPGDPQALAQTVLHLKSHPSQAARMGLNGKEYVNKHFNRAVLAKILNEVLEITLQVHRRRIQG